jgi:hypothetical protein
VSLKTVVLPVAFVKLPDTKSYDLSGGLTRRRACAASMRFSSPVARSGAAPHAGDARWRLGERDVAIAAKPSKLPAWAKTDKRWIDISIHAQTLVLYEGQRAVYATAISTGRDGLGDPKKTLSTPTGTFNIREKHLTTTMDANEVDNKFELRDVPWVQFQGRRAPRGALSTTSVAAQPRLHQQSPSMRGGCSRSTPDLPADWLAEPGAGGPEGTTIYIHS